MTLAESFELVCAHDRRVHVVEDVHHFQPPFGAAGAQSDPDTRACTPRTADDSRVSVRGTTASASRLNSSRWFDERRCHERHVAAITNARSPSASTSVASAAWRPPSGPQPDRSRSRDPAHRRMAGRRRRRAECRGLSHGQQHLDLTIENRPPVDDERALVAAAESPGAPAGQDRRARCSLGKSYS